MQTRQRYRQFGVILLLIMLIRVYDGVTDGSSWRVSVYDSTAWWIVLGLCAIFTSGLTAILARTHVARPITVLLSALMGSATTLAASSAPGMVMGGIIGLLIALDGTRWLVFAFCRGCVTAVLPAAAIGTTAGLFGSVAYFHVDGSLRWIVPICAIFLMTICFAFWCGYARRLVSGRFQFLGLMAICLFSILAFIPVGVQLDTIRRANAIGDIALLERVYGFPQTLIRGLWDVNELDFGADSTNDDLEYARGFPYVTKIWSFKSRITDDGLGSLETKRLTSFRYRNSSTVSSEGFHFLEACSGMVTLDLRASNISDEGLRLLRGMPKLTQLFLADTRIDGSGLQNLRPSCPLNFLVLSNTDVDDHALVHLKSLPSLMILDLRGTRLRGPGLRHLAHSPLLQHLNLSGIELQDQHLEELALCPALRILVLDDIQLTRQGIENIAAIGSLNRLVISETTINDVSIKPLKRLTQLQVLSVGANELTPLAYESISHLRHVELVYDARTLPLNEIIRQLQQLVSSKWKSIENSNLFPVIRHVNIDDEQMLAEVDRLQFRFKLKFERLRYRGSDRHQGQPLSLDTIRFLIARDPQE